MAFSASSLSPLDPAVTEKGKKLVSSPAIKKALEHIRQNDAQCVRDQVEVASIESPRFGEANRRNKIEEILTLLFNTILLSPFLYRFPAAVRLISA